MKLPTILIVADYRYLFAYMILADGLPEVVEKIDYINDGQTSVPLVGWDDGRDGYQAIAENITFILERYQPATWALACPPMLAKNIVRWLPMEQQASLGILRQTNVENVEISNVCQIFDATTSDYASQKEHC
ncbi:hypothetical protein JIN84_15540 [Luteolibacter yonseiensis]|uniref:Uncharacterized protein n=1 Tax=Luteolibacter yonseiensis TaxID=1144680 RepID=A0A934R612_9BACT|nr:hypothetical protein [Luteolibacter yonseiensis]MBK1817037.1 hypothetical protein [Luteolibacter yonseiensis]